MARETPSWQELASLAATAGEIGLAGLFADEERAERFSIEIPGIYYDYSKHLVTDRIMDTLVALAEESAIQDKARIMFEGGRINVSEDRAVLHMAMRNPSSNLDAEVVNSIASQKQRLKAISDDIREGRWQGKTGRPITDVVNIGIGGSDLGPKMVCEALREFADGPGCHFISNVDGAEINHLLARLDAESTLFIISSKTFTTAETLLNAKTALAWLGEKLGDATPEGSSHCIAVTSDGSNAIEFGIPEDQVLTFPQAIGGRYSLWSPIGLPICIAVGYDKFAEMLEGAAAMDEHFLSAPCRNNMPIVMALLGIWYNNFLKVRSLAVIPYCQRLRLFIDHLQQLDMESSGKSTDIQGKTVDVDTGPVVWGQTGTNGQHAFFQLLHQGTQYVPIDFIGVVRDKTSSPEHHRMLLANMIAQSEALMIGKISEDHHQHYAGNRPSSTILLDELSPYDLGLLTALYEHKVFAQGVIWRINSFDQWGVELGKQLSRAVLAGGGDHDASTLRLMKKTGLAD